MTIASSLCRRARFAAIGIVAAAPLARAQTAGPDPAAIWTLQDENASISTANLTDRYYVNGLRLGYASPEDAVTLADRISDAIWGPGGLTRLTVDLSQQIYTPADTKAFVPPPGDRPYAGVLLATVGALRDADDTRSMLALSLGVLGPDALAETVQNGFHNIIGQGHTNGWHSQLQNEPLGEITAGRVWRVPVAELGGLETDTLPDLAAGIGNERDYAQAGVLVRIGQGLASDYGPARVAPGPSGWDAYKPTQPFVWYVFAGADGQAVGHDITLNGNSFQDSAQVTLKPLVGEMELGLGMMFWGARLTYTQVFQTQEFANQHGGLHQFGSLALSMRF